jgi:cell division protein FtsQ
MTMRVPGRRGSAVLEAPEERYASGTSGPRRAAGGLRRDLQEDFGRNFDRNFADEGFGSDDFDSGPAEEGSPVRRRAGVRGRVRPGVLGKILGMLPQTLGGRIAAGTAFVAVGGLGVAGALAVRSALLHDARFVIPSSAAIQVEGNRHVTKAQLLSIFGGDVERNIFTVSLAERRTELERLPWVEHATVMRLLPDHVRVSIAERTPVAFVRQGGHIGLVDRNGVLMDMVSGAGEEVGSGAHYSFPVVTGIMAGEPLSTRAARMKIFERFTSELDAGGAKISEGLSEVDLSDPEDVRALIPEEHSEVLVHFGDSDFLDRYEKYKAHLAEWRMQYPKLTSVDMRYDRQVVLEMQPGSAVPVQGAIEAAPAVAPATAGGKSAPAKVAPKATSAAGVHPGAAGPAHAAAARPLVGTKPATAAGKNPGGDVVPAADAAPAAGVASHLTVAKDVPVAKTGVKKPVAKRSAGKKAAAKKTVGKKVVAKKAGSVQTHPPAVRP